MHHRGKGSIKFSCLTIKPFPPPSIQVQRERKYQGHSYNWHITDRAYWKYTTCKVLTFAYSRCHLHYQYAHPFPHKCFLVLICNQFFLLLMLLPYFLRTLNLFFYRLAYIVYNIGGLHFFRILYKWNYATYTHVLSCFFSKWFHEAWFWFDFVCQ